MIKTVEFLEKVERDLDSESEQMRLAYDVVQKIMVDASLKSEAERVTKFGELTGYGIATYYYLSGGKAKDMRANERMIRHAEYKEKAEKKE